MTLTGTLLTKLGYLGAKQWLTEPPGDLVQAQNHRLARRAGIVGGYYVSSAPREWLPADPSVFPVLYVAEARDAQDARRLRKSVWNLGSAPFLLVVLPHEVRVYASFVYSTSQDLDGLLVAEPTSISEYDLLEALSPYHRSEIDNGNIWNLKPEALQINRRVDEHLLRNLQALGERLRNDYQLTTHVAHALIGKFIYIRYLYHRGIVSQNWMAERGINFDHIFTRRATTTALTKLVTELEARFGGRVFPYLDHYEPPSDEVVRFVARVFAGEEANSGQLPLDFAVYDFSYIPVELLSSVYEHFLRVENGHRTVGAFYTPEVLADYVLSQTNGVVPIQPNMRVLDPCCGSGVFLVLALRRLIEQHLRNARATRLRPTTLREILCSSIFGVERNLEACYVTEFSLLLTLFAYIEPPDLQRYANFRFPDLHNTNIIHGDFFDPELPLRDQRFDWVVGNPPWLELPIDSDQAHLLTWIASTASEMPVPRRRTGEAFAWRAGEMLTTEGVAGLILQSTTLLNEQLKPFRSAFFSRYDVVRVSNFANFAYVLFAGRADTPACVLIYKQRNLFASPTILHYGPFVAQQNTLRPQRQKRRAWVLTINSSEINQVAQGDARSGDGTVWKLALWGGTRDKRNVRRLKALFPETVASFCEDHGLQIGLGVQLRPQTTNEKRVPAKALAHKRVLNGRALFQSKSTLTIPDSALDDPLPEAAAFVRERGGLAGVGLAEGPHIVIGPLFAAFDDRDFVVPHPKVAIAGAPSQERILRALSLYMASSVAQYLLFLLSVRWGIDRRDLVLSDVQELPCPILTEMRIGAMSAAHQRLAEEEAAGTPAATLRARIDEAVAEVLDLPEHLAVMAREFVIFKMPMDKGKVPSHAWVSPTGAILERYQNRLRSELEEFSKIPHQVMIGRCGDLMCCEIRRGLWKDNKKNGPLFDNNSALSDHLRTRESQWAYVQRSIRVFQRDRIFICKMPHALNWSETEAIEDSDDVIAEVISIGESVD